MSMQLMNFRSDLISLKQQMEQYVDPYVGKNLKLAKKVQDIENIYYTKLEATKPEVMIYGLYNAGKSSILNELLGEDKAKVQDIPTTDKVTYYDWNGYRIADTPGIGAPIQHENITQEHLKQADVVIFVMSTTGSNERQENYVRMKDIADSGKKIIIVLNDKNGDLFSGVGDSDIQVIKQKVAANMQQVGIMDVENQYYIITVNAERARNGRWKGNQQLLLKSNISELANVIMQELKKTDVFFILGNAVQEVECLLHEMIDIMVSMESDHNLKKISMFLEKIHDRKKELRETVYTSIDYKVNCLGGELPGIIWSNRNKTDNEINHMIQERIAKVADQIQQDFENKFHEMAQDLLDSAEMLHFQTEKPVYKTENIDDISDTIIDTRKFDFFAVLSNLNKLLKDVTFNNKETSSKNTGATDWAASATVGQAASEAVKKVAKTAIGKSILATTIGKNILGPMIPVIGPVITFVPLLVKLLGGGDDSAQMRAEVEVRNEQMRKQAEAETQARMELNQKCKYMAMDLADTFKSSIEQSLQKILGAVVEPFKEECKNLTVENSKFHMDLAAMRELVDKYAVLRESLKTSSSLNS